MGGACSETLATGGDRGGGLFIWKWWLGDDLGAFRSTTLEMAGCDQTLSLPLLSGKAVLAVVPPRRANLNLDGFASYAVVGVDTIGESTVSGFLGGATADIEDG